MSATAALRRYSSVQSPVGVDVISSSRRFFFACKNFESSGVVTGRGDRFDKGLGDLGGGLFVDGPIECKHATESRDGIGLERLSGSFGEGGLLGASAGVRVFDDGGGRVRKFQDQLPGGIEID